MAAWLLLACCLATWPPSIAQAATAAPAAAASASRPEPASPVVAPAISNATRALDTSALLATQPLAPFIEFLVDPTGALSVDELLSPSHQAGFTPLGNGLPLFRSGSTWLRLTLAPRPPDGQNRQLLLDLGRDLPGSATLFLAKRNQPGEPNEWQAQAPEGGNVFTLPDPVGKPLPVYVKLDGVPGPWFAPMLRTPQNAASTNDGLARPLVIGVLVAVLALCLLRGVFERGEWRLWTSLFVAAVLAQAVAGQPPTPAGYVPLRGLPGVLAPGLALMLLPHVGRHLLRTREHAASADMQLRVVSLVGAILALLPLVPGMAWSSRLLALWPLLLVLLLPAAVACKFRKLPGSRRFLTGCLAALAGAGVGIAGLASPMPAVWISTAPLWGLALLALLVAGTSAPRPAEAEGTLTGGRGYRVRKSPAAERPDLDDPLSDEPTLRMISPEELRGGLAPSPRTPAALATGNALPPDEATAPEGATVDGNMADEPLELSLGDVLPELDGTPTPRGSRRLARAAAMAGRTDFATGFTTGGANGNAGDYLPGVATPPAPSTGLDPLALARMEEALLAPIDAMLQELDGLENCALPPAARSHAEAVGTAGRQLAAIAEDLGRVAAPQRTAPRRAVFDLQRMLRDAHDAVADRAERKGLAISWFMAPHLSQLYEGDAGQLGELLRLLAESSVRSTDKGSVHMSVRRVPDSTDPGHLLFTVSDSGAGAPPHKRSVSALARAWEMADAAGGTLTVESGRGQGTTISFTARLVALSGDATAPRPFVGVDLTDDLRVARPTPDAVTAADHLHLGPVAPRRPLQVIVADDVPSNRQLLAFFLEGLPHAPLEARGATEAGILYRRAPSGLVIMDGDMPEDDIVAALASIRAFEQEHGLPPVPVLALVSHEAQAERMLAAGCTETLEKPLTRSGLRAAVQRLASPHAEPDPQPEYTGYAGYGASAAELPYGEEGDDAHAAPPDFAELPDLFLAAAGNGADGGLAGNAGTGELSLAGDAAPDWNATPAWDAPEATWDGAHADDTPARPHDTIMDALPELPDGESRPDGDALAEPAADEPTAWHPWDRPVSGSVLPGALATGAQELAPLSPEAAHAMADATSPGEDHAEAEELPDLFGADIFAVGHADPAVAPQASASGATPATGASHDGSLLPEGGSLLDLIVTDAEDAEPVDEAPTAPSQPPATPPSAAPVSASLTPSIMAEELAATVAAAATTAAASTTVWGDDFEESVGEPMPVATAPAQPPVAGAAATTARQERADAHSEGAGAAVRKPSSPADGGEWVGDPMPMEPHRSTTHAGASASSSYGAAARLERWERAQRAQQQGQRAVPHPSPEQRGQQTAEQTPALPQPPDTRPIRDLSAEVRPGYRPKQPPQPAGQVTPGQAPAGQTPHGQAQPASTPVAPAAPGIPTAPAWPTGQQTGQTLPPQMQYTRPQPGQQAASTPAAQSPHTPVQASHGQAPLSSPHSQTATPQQAAPAKSFAERIAERIAVHLGRGADRARSPENDATRRAPSQAAPSQPARSGAAPARPASPVPPAASGGQRTEPHGHMGDDIEPFIPGLLETLDAALDDARRGRADGSTFAVQEAAARIAGKAESFGLRVLERIARCVERAATADDMEAVRDLLPELEAAVERNRIALAPRAGQPARRG